MADEASNIPSPFDVRTIKYLVRLMSTHDLSEIDLREGDLRIRLRRGAGETAVLHSVAAASGTPPPTAPSAASPPQAIAPSAEPPAKPYSTIKSPTPGTFYTSASPDAEPFVKVGSRVAPNTVVCVIEAMKIFNEITADCSGVITEICIENQQAVEFNQVLFKVDPTA